MSFTIRQALPSDIPQIRDIYNYYVRNTTISLKLHEASEEYIASRLDSTLERGLPYLVAVSARSKIDDEGGNEVLGYAHLSPFSADKAGYSPAVELTLYLRSDSMSGGIGTALMRELVEWVAGRKYWAFEGDQVVKREGEGRSEIASEDGNGWVKVKQIYAIMSQDVEGKEEWVSRGERNRDWYAGKFGFSEVGRLPGVGEKFGKRLDVIYMMKEI